MWEQPIDNWGITVYVFLWMHPSKHDQSESFFNLKSNKFDGLKNRLKMLLSLNWTTSSKLLIWNSLANELSDATVYVIFTSHRTLFIEDTIQMSMCLHVWEGSKTCSHNHSQTKLRRRFKHVMSRYKCSHDRLAGFNASLIRTLANWLCKLLHFPALTIASGTHYYFNCLKQ